MMDHIKYTGHTARNRRAIRADRQVQLRKQKRRQSISRLRDSRFPYSVKETTHIGALINSAFQSEEAAVHITQSEIGVVFRCMRFQETAQDAVKCLLNLLSWPASQEAASPVLDAMMDTAQLHTTSISLQSTVMQCCAVALEGENVPEHYKEKLSNDFFLRHIIDGLLAIVVDSRYSDPMISNLLSHILDFGQCRAERMGPDSMSERLLDIVYQYIDMSIDDEDMLIYGALVATPSMHPGPYCSPEMLNVVHGTASDRWDDSLQVSDDPEELWQSSQDVYGLALKAITPVTLTPKDWVPLLPPPGNLDYLSETETILLAAAVCKGILGLRRNLAASFTTELQLAARSITYYTFLQPDDELCLFANTLAAAGNDIFTVLDEDLISRVREVAQRGFQDAPTDEVFIAMQELLDVLDDESG